MGPASANAVLRRRRVVRVQCDGRDVAVPAEIGQPLDVARGGDDFVALGQQFGDEPGSDIAGGPGDQNSHWFHRTVLPALS